MIAGYFVFASFTASITSALAVDELRGDIRGPSDLPGQTVATVAGSEAEDYLTAQGVGPMLVDEIDDAYAQLTAGEVDAVVFDAPILRYHASHDGRGQVRVVGPTFDDVRYGMAVGGGAGRREAVNIALLELIEDGLYDQLDEQWFGALDE